MDKVYLIGAEVLAELGAAKTFVSNLSDNLPSLAKSTCECSLAVIDMDGIFNYEGGETRQGCANGLLVLDEGSEKTLACVL